MQTVTLDEAKAHLVDLIEAAAGGEEIFIAKDDHVSVQLVPRVVKQRKRQFGSARGLISMEPDFDEPLEDFKEYIGCAPKKHIGVAAVDCADCGIITH